MPKVAKPQRHGNRWRITFRDADGRRQFESFLTFREAQDALHRRNVESEAIRGGLSPRPPDPHTFDELADYWLEHRTEAKRSPKDDKSIIGRHLRPSFGRMMVSELNVQHLDRYVASRRSLSPKTVTNHLTLLGAMFQLAIELGWLASAPRIRKPELVEQDYQWLRTADDIRALLDAATQEEPGVMELYAMAVYTGLRAGELLGLRWEDIDVAHRLIKVQRSYDKPTKTARIRHVPILDPLLPVLRRWHGTNLLPCVFPGSTGAPRGPSAQVLQEVLQRCLVRARLTEDGGDVPQGLGGARDRRGRYAGLTFHDLRHTFASHWVLRGGDIFRLQKILGHTTTQMTQRYAHLAPEAFSADWSRLGDMLPKEGQVLVLALPAGE